MKNINPIEKDKMLQNFVSFFKDFNKFFSNDKVDIIVNQEFSQKYELLPLLVKARMYYNQQ